AVRCCAGDRERRGGGEVHGGGNCSGAQRLEVEEAVVGDLGRARDGGREDVGHGNQSVVVLLRRPSVIPGIRAVVVRTHHVVFAGIGIASIHVGVGGEVIVE